MYGEAVLLRSSSYEGYTSLKNVAVPYEALRECKLEVVNFTIHKNRVCNIILLYLLRGLYYLRIVTVSTTSSAVIGSTAKEFVCANSLFVRSHFLYPYYHYRLAIHKQL